MSSGSEEYWQAYHYFKNLPENKGIPAKEVRTLFGPVWKEWKVGKNLPKKNIFSSTPPSSPKQKERRKSSGSRKKKQPAQEQKEEKKERKSSGGRKKKVETENKKEQELKRQEEEYNRSREHYALSLQSFMTELKVVSDEIPERLVNAQSKEELEQIYTEALKEMYLREQQLQIIKRNCRKYVQGDVCNDLETKTSVMFQRLRNSLEKLRESKLRSFQPKQKVQVKERRLDEHPIATAIASFVAASIASILNNKNMTDPEKKTELNRVRTLVKKNLTLIYHPDKCEPNENKFMTILAKDPDNPYLKKLISRLILINQQSPDPLTRETCEEIFKEIANQLDEFDDAIEEVTEPNEYEFK